MLVSVQLLVEIPAGQNDAMDLSGDAGAVGRLSSIGDDGKGFTMLLDLKGVVYNAALVEIPCTACVVAMGQHEAKVRAIPSLLLVLLHMLGVSWAGSACCGHAAQHCACTVRCACLAMLLGTGLHPHAACRSIPKYSLHDSCEHGSLLAMSLAPAR